MQQIQRLIMASVLVLALGISALATITVTKSSIAFAVTTCADGAVTCETSDDPCKSLEGTPEWAACNRQGNNVGGSADESNNELPAANSDSEIPTANDKDYKNCKVADGETLNENNCGIIELIVAATNIMTGLAAIVIVGMVIWGGIQYSMAGADPSKVQAAKGKIFNALLALVLLIFGWSILQWLIPGGVLGGIR